MNKLMQYNGIQWVEIGKNGHSPIRGIDYWTKEDMDFILKEIKKMIPKIKDGISPKIEDVVSEFKKQPLEYKDIKGAPDLKDLPALIAFLKRGGFRGGGNSTTAGSVTYSYDLSAQCNGSNKVFTIPLFSRIILLTGTDAPIIYKPTTDYTATGTTLTLDAGVDAPSLGATLIITYTP